MARKQARRLARYQRGFTLIELLMAMMAGMLVSIAAFSFSKQSTRLFTREARVAAAQMSVLAGFQRLQADVSRAAFLSTPNLARDVYLHRVCAPNYSSWPQTLKQLAGIRVTVEGSTTAPKLPDDKRPDSIRVAGSMSSVEIFTVNAIQPHGSGHAIYLRAGDGPMTRSGFTPGADITSVFRPGRIIRVSDGEKDAYEIIRSAQYPNSGQPTVVTVGPLPDRSLLSGTGSVRCGFAMGTGLQLNVVNVVDYAIASLKNLPVYRKTVYSDAATALGDQNRTELVRREVLLTSGNVPPIESDPNSEIVAEYAVDLRVGLWVTNNPITAGLVFLQPSTPAVSQRTAIASSFSYGPPTGPGSVRAVQLRLAVRSREPDRWSPTDDELLDAGLFHRVPVDQNKTYWARVRTLVADVSLMNQGGDAW